ncbi:hypothetical protein TVAG_491680 [Trichomonas vaginalis G3]|uniref:Uncharacterized protein n=1 Tax=Trichomonas vaginalis (strain ATCC PRA-98 / G3) TaxID=412133 RepID=A2EAJ9_TRIV3|nr:spectrin binding [Trichomonas vaginalis G3]EAY10310.1 hypothetical protein TVAG_491680 [Trichomonas vaginalis G3]KAI5491027.1 spectrin binding [Trichomonas vaginalis G3]|eukprot:XP_001322533.1 hypothetical protein [Trichomonas vaginalis G3]
MKSIIANDNDDALISLASNDIIIDSNGEKFDKQQIFILCCQYSACRCFNALYMQHSFQDVDQDALVIAASTYGSVEILEMLHNLNVNLNSAFDASIISGKYDVLIYLYNSVYDDIASNLSNKENLIHSVKGGNLDCVKFLIEMINDQEKLYDINYVNHDGDSALSVAIDKNRPDIVDYLIRKGASLKTENNIIEKAIMTNNINVLGQFLKSPEFDPKSHVEFAITNKMEQSTALLLMYSKRLSTPQLVHFLFIAVQNNLLNITKILLQNGIPGNATNDNKETILHIAASQGNSNMINLILNFGRNINVNALDIKRRTPIQRAISSGHPECVKLIIGKTDV